MTSSTSDFQQYNNRLYSVIKRADVQHIDHTEILNEHPDLYVTSNNLQKVVIKYAGPTTPQFLSGIDHDGPYDHQTIHSVIDGEDWYKDPTKNSRTVRLK